ncbi:MAG TPA: 50S ribosomal protein L4 [Nitrospiria bacterium]|jgi:large subunit ribosomal protein L4|nr:50S ribosomal protein L4 [Nitrospiria bacterium]
MPTIDVVNLSKEKVGTVDLDERLFAAKVNKPLIHEAVVMQQASRRQGTAATKTRGLVSGGGKKPWRQKGTGRARAGSTRSPLWRGGGTTFGPTPRDYGYAFPKKKYRAALRGVLTAKLNDGAVLVVERLELGEGKTKQVAQILKNLEATGRTVIVASTIDEKLARAVRNIPGLKLLAVQGLNVYDLVCARHLLIPQEVLSRIREVWS